jgi:hypothetical protein
MELYAVPVCYPAPSLYLHGKSSVTADCSNKVNIGIFYLTESIKIMF